MEKMRFLFLMMAWGFLPVSTGWATTFYERPFPEVVQETPVVVRGTINSSYADWGKAEDGTKRIYTYWELQISEVFRGNVEGRTLMMKQIGGEKDGMGLQVAGTARFDRGEDVVVFLAPKSPDGSYELRGLSTGKLNIEKDEGGHEVLTGPAVPGGAGDDGHGHLGHENATGGHPDSDPGNPWTVDSLRKLVKEQDGEKQVKNSEVISKSVKAMPVASNTPEGASQLQPPPGGEAEGSPSQSFSGWLGLALKVLGGIGVLGLLGFAWKKLF